MAFTPACPDGRLWIRWRLYPGSLDTINVLLDQSTQVVFERGFEKAKEPGSRWAPLNLAVMQQPGKFGSAFRLQFIQVQCGIGGIGVPDHNATYQPLNLEVNLFRQGQKAFDLVVGRFRAVGWFGLELGWSFLFFMPRGCDRKVIQDNSSRFAGQKVWVPLCRFLPGSGKIGSR